jgi:hypothetical protein
MIIVITQNMIPKDKEDINKKEEDREGATTTSSSITILKFSISILFPKPKCCVMKFLF